MREVTVDAVTTEVLVVIVTHQSAPVIDACLQSLPDALIDVPNHRVVVVDNASTDETCAIVADRAPTATVLELGENVGYASAINAAVEKSPPAEHVLVLNPDVRLSARSVRAMLDAATRPGVGIVVPRLHDPDGRVQLSLRREPTIARALAAALVGGRRAARWGSLGEVVGDVARYDYEQPVEWATGAAMLITRRCLDAVGPWDESFFLYSEETDFSLRARDAGFLTWFTPHATAVHLGGESDTSPELWALLTRNRVRLYRKRHGLVRSLLFELVVVLNEAIRAMTGSRTHRAALRALRDPASNAPPARPTPPPGWICFSSVDWWYHNRAHSEIQLMRRIARERTVLFVNTIGMRMPLPGRSTQPVRRIARKLMSILRFVRRPLADTPGFNVVTPFILPFYGSSAIRALNARMVRAQVRFLARRVGIDPDDAIVVVTVPTAWDVVRGMKRRRLLYNRSDLHSAFEETDQRVIRSLEQELLRNSDAVLYVSHSLLDAERDVAGEKGVFLDHGVDLAHFGGDPGPEPRELASIPRPRVGFFGGIDDYLVDFDLLEKVAREIPDASLVLIGDATCSMARFDDLPNVHWLGYKPYEQIPAFGAAFDVALMPWLDNEWIEHSNPIKLKEYLALGLPIVSVDFPEVHHYRDVVAVASDPDDFVHLIREVLAGREVGTTASRRARVAAGTWDDRACELLAIGEEPS